MPTAVPARPLRLALALLAVAASGCGAPAEEPAPAAAEPGAEAPPAVAQDTPEAAAGAALDVGDPAPDFALPDAMGRSVRLSDLTARGPVVLTFYRGAWCPYCNTQLHDYQAALAAVEADGASLVAVSPQAPDGTMSMQEKHALTFPVLSDVGNRVSRQYGLVYRVDDAVRQRYEAVGIDLAQVNGDDTWELPVPATYVIDASGTIRAAFVEADYTKRADPRAILEALGAVG